MIQTNAPDKLDTPNSNEAWLIKNIQMLNDMMMGGWVLEPHKLRAMQSVTDDGMHQEFMQRAKKTVENLRLQLSSKKKATGVCHERSSGSALEAIRNENGGG